MMYAILGCHPIKIRRIRTFDTTAMTQLKLHNCGEGLNIQELDPSGKLAPKRMKKQDLASMGFMFRKDYAGIQGVETPQQYLNRKKT